MSGQYRIFVTIKYLSGPLQGKTVEGGHSLVVNAGEQCNHIRAWLISRPILHIGKTEVQVVEIHRIRRVTG